LGITGMERQVYIITLMINTDTLTPSTYLPDDEYLAISHGFESDGAVADAMYIDYIGAWSER